jgi:hypothetical protein
MCSLGKRPKSATSTTLNDQQNQGKSAFMPVAAEARYHWDDILGYVHSGSTYSTYVHTV